MVYFLQTGVVLLGMYLCSVFKTFTAATSYSDDFTVCLFVFKPCYRHVLLWLWFSIGLNCHSSAVSHIGASYRPRRVISVRDYAFHPLTTFTHVHVTSMHTRHMWRWAHAVDGRWATWPKRSVCCHAPFFSSALWPLTSVGLQPPWTYWVWRTVTVLSHISLFLLHGQEGHSHHYYSVGMSQPMTWQPPAMFVCCLCLLVCTIKVIGYVLTTC